MAKKKENTTTTATAPVAPVAQVAPVAPVAPVQKDTCNGITRPNPTTTTGKIWVIADNYSASTKLPATRKDVLAEAEAQGINMATAATQYGKWCKYNGVSNRTTPKEKPANKAKVAEGGVQVATIPQMAMEEEVDDQGEVFFDEMEE